MTTRIGMASYDTLNKAASEAGIEAVNYSEAYSVYESGMIDVLTQVAILRLLELDEVGRRPYPPVYDKAVEKQAELLNEIMDALPEEYKELRHDLEHIESEMHCIEMDDQFIRGFVEGYRYLRNLNSSYRGPLLDVRK